MADSPPASAASVRTLEQLHEARAQIALLEQRNRHLESVVDGLLKPYGKLKALSSGGARWNYEISARVDHLERGGPAVGGGSASCAGAVGGGAVPRRGSATL